MNSQNAEEGLRILCDILRLKRVLKQLLGMQLQALIRATTDMFACPAFLVHAFHDSRSDTVAAHHSLDVGLINATFTSLLKVWLRQGRHPA